MDYRTALWLAALALAPETLNGQVAPSTQTTTPLPSAQAYLSRSGTTTKPSAEDYPVRAKLEKLSIGAEYMVHSFSSGRQMFIAKDYLVVEVALFPAKGENLLVDAGQFTLRVNGRKQALSPQSPVRAACDRRYLPFEYLARTTGEAHSHEPGKGGSGAGCGRECRQDVVAGARWNRSSAAELHHVIVEPI